MSSLVNFGDLRHLDIFTIGQVENEDAPFRTYVKSLSQDVPSMCLGAVGIDDDMKIVNFPPDTLVHRVGNLRALLDRVL